MLYENTILHEECKCIQFKYSTFLSPSEEMSAVSIASKRPFWIFIEDIEYSHKAAAVTLGYKNLQTRPKIAILSGTWN